MDTHDSRPPRSRGRHTESDTPIFDRLLAEEEWKRSGQVPGHTPPPGRELLPARGFVPAARAH